MFPKQIQTLEFRIAKEDNQMKKPKSNYFSIAFLILLIHKT